MGGGWAHYKPGQLDNRKKMEQQFPKDFKDKPVKIGDHIFRLKAIKLNNHGNPSPQGRFTAYQVVQCGGLFKATASATAA